MVNCEATELVVAVLYDTIINRRRDNEIKIVLDLEECFSMLPLFSLDFHIVMIQTMHLCKYHVRTFVTLFHSFAVQKLVIDNIQNCCYMYCFITKHSMLDLSS